MSYSQAIFILSITYLGINAVPPEACFANFRSDDCGSPPVRVLYYWKPGSRCEVGVWRGCLPNINMFKDEYECVATCIFVARAVPEDYHALSPSDNNETEISIEDTTPMTSGELNATESTDLDTNISPDENATDASGGGTTVSGDDGNQSDNSTNTSGNSTAGPNSTNPGA